MKEKPVIIKFFAPVVDSTINALLNAIDQKLKMGTTEFKILISSPGGSVFHGLTAYNYLRGIPANITTHNFGSVDSIGLVLYCGGDKRLSVPQARFLLHGVSTKFPPNETLEEPQLEERLKALRIDVENISKVVAENSGMELSRVTRMMLERTTINPQEALEMGLVHDISSRLFEAGSEIISIQFQKNERPMVHNPQQHGINR